MSDKMGGSSNVKVPAWKLRQQQRQRDNALLVKRATDDLGGPRRPRGSDELGGKSNGTGRVPAWKLREQMKSGRRDNDLDDSSSVASASSTRSTYSRTSTSSTPSSKARAVSMVPDDPNLPPAFRTMNKINQRKRIDDFNSLCSVHSRSVTGSRAGGSRMDRSAAHSYANSYGSNDSFEFLESDSDDDSLSGGSFASLDSDADEDDEAYRESRNQMARLQIEKQKQSLDSKRVGKSRFKKKSTGVHGTTLDFIAE